MSYSAFLTKSNKQRSTRIAPVNSNDADVNPFQSKITRAYAGTVFLDVCSVSIKWTDCANCDLDYDHVRKLASVFEAGIHCVEESKCLKASVTMLLSRVGDRFVASSVSAWLWSWSAPPFFPPPYPALLLTHQALQTLKCRLSKACGYAEGGHGDSENASWG